ncbi:MAG TPA: hypothetical protein VGZ22_29140 [Isosphaeraceae bacterium]|nr:hypothetical protein [Isosphaeraceae bacterium]
MIVVLLLFLAAEVTSQRWAAVLAGVAGLLIAYLFLDKGTFMLAGGGLIGVHLVLSLSRRRIGSAAALLGGVIAGFIGLWLLAGQSIDGIPSYFRTSFEIIAGYAAAMSWFLESGAQHPALQWGIALVMLGVTGVLLAIAAWRRDWSLFRLLLLISPVMFFLFKNAFVRFDEAHAVEFWALVAILMSLVLALAVGVKSDFKRGAHSALAGVTVLASVALVSGLAPLIGGVSGMQPTLPFPKNLASYGHTAALLVRPDRRQQEEAQVRASLQAAYPLPPEVLARLRQGTVDCIPLDLQMCLAYDFQWDPQPVFQSYNAWRPYLDHIDAQHYTGPAAPRFVLFAAKTIDGRYPLFDEPEAHRALMENYRVVDHVSFVVVLERRDGTQQPQQNEAGVVTARFGEWIDVPQHGDQRLYGRVQVAYSLLGLALNLLHRPPEVHIFFKYSGGQVSPAYRLVTANAPDGLDLSSYAPDTEGAGRLAEGQFDQPIEAIKIVTESPAEAYQQEIHLDYFTEPVN